MLLPIHAFCRVRLLGLSIKNFRSLLDFQLSSGAGLDRFICLVGPNGAGKSTFLHAMSFLSQLGERSLDTWLEARGWKRSDLRSYQVRNVLIGFRVTIASPRHQRIVWSGAFSPSRGRCIREEILVVKNETTQRVLGHTTSGEIVISKDDTRRSVDVKGLDFEGSCLSILNEEWLPTAAIDVKTFLHSIRALDMISPERMRKRAKSAQHLGHGGENLSAYLAGLTAEQKSTILKDLQSFYPQVTGLTTKSLQAGWKQLFIEEAFKDGQGRNFNSDARAINDGLLRILAIIAQCRGEESFSLFDEIENGIHPETLERLVSYLLERARDDSGQQIVVTTHNPLLLNYLPDDQARDSVFLLFRGPDGGTRAVRYFDNPETATKLGLLGAGEVYVDTPISSVIAATISPES